MTAQQAHRYRLGNHDVLALSSGNYPRVARIVSGAPYGMPDALGTPFEVNAGSLTPLPMAYYKGELPDDKA